MGCLLPLGDWGMIIERVMVVVIGAVSFVVIGGCGTGGHCWWSELM